MYQQVDLVGLEAVCKMIEQTGLKKFIIYRQGAAKGSTPVYDCSALNQNAGALKSFRDWAQNIVTFNPNNAMCYEILLFSNDSDLEDENNAVKKKSKIRFSFALSANIGYSQNNNGNINVQEEIKRGIEMYELKHQIKQLEEKLNGDDDDDDDEDQDMGDYLDKFRGILKEINTSSENKLKAAKINGSKDDEDDLGEDDDDIDVKDRSRETKIKNQTKALRVLWKENKNLDLDLLLLARMSQEKPIMFKLALEKIRNEMK
jgi:hypothetical protein